MARLGLTSMPSALTGALAGAPSPAELVRGIRDLSKKLERIVAGTDALPEIHTGITQVAENAAVLPSLQSSIEAMTRATTDMQRDTASIAKTVPALVDLQQSLPALVPVLQELSALIERLQTSLVQLEVTVHTLATVAEPLQGAAERLGRFADRLPRRAARGDTGAS